MRSVLALALILALAAPAVAATPFADVPKTHWAYDAIQQAVDAGILQGYDGKFHGQRLLNRYQMAVIVAKLLDAVKAPGAVAKGPEGGKTVANLEALTIEFADELALLNVKVSTLEDTFTELKNDVAAMKGGKGGAVAYDGKGLGFTAFASFGLISTDDGTVGPSAPNPPNPLTRYTGSNPDSTFFTLPQVSIGVDKEVNPGVYFHAQFDYASDVDADEYDWAGGPGPGGSIGHVGINECYFFVDELLGDIGGKVGAFALPYSLEHNGPFRTCNLTITPSGVNTLNESWRGYGLEFQRTKDVKPEDIIWKVGILSGTDSVSRLFGGVGGGQLWSDSPVLINGSGERDDGFGYYLYIGKKPEKRGFGWHLGYFDNGGDNNIQNGVGGEVHFASPEVDYWQVGFEWWGEKFGVMGQYVDGSLAYAPAPTPEADFTLWYLLVNFIVDDKNNVTLRYDSAELDPNFTPVNSIWEADGFTFAFNHKVTENSMFQFEWISPDDNETNTVGYEDTDDDLIQLRYKVHF